MAWRRTGDQPLSGPVPTQFTDNGDDNYNDINNDDDNNNNETMVIMMISLMLIII